MTLRYADRSTIENGVHRLYVAWIRPHLSSPLTQQRFKLLWFGWGYWSILMLPRLSLPQKIILLYRFLKIDWSVLHGHTPSECAIVCRALTERPRTGQVMVEAGCWEGGSSAKWSVICHFVGMSLIIYDSFEGVEPGASPTGDYDYSGEYAAQEATVLSHLAAYGQFEICRTVKGWFSRTMQPRMVPSPIGVTYIDCDTAKGTQEALSGILPSLAPHGVIFTQDGHIPSVVRMLTNLDTWKNLSVSMPRMTRLGWRMIRLEWPTA